MTERIVNLNDTSIETLRRIRDTLRGLREDIDAEFDIGMEDFDDGTGLHFRLKAILAPAFHEWLDGVEGHVVDMPAEEWCVILRLMVEGVGYVCGTLWAACGSPTLEGETHAS